MVTTILLGHVAEQLTISLYIKMTCMLGWRQVKLVILIFGHGHSSVKLAYLKHLTFCMLWAQDEDDKILLLVQFGATDLIPASVPAVKSIIAFTPLVQMLTKLKR